MDCCIGRLAEFSHPDPHAKSGRYFVRSLYYDDMYESACEDKENGVRSRHKFRIRTYNYDSSYICLEKKIKEGFFVKKDYSVISENDLERIIKGDTGFLIGKEDRCAKDFAVEWNTKALRPRIYVDYDRVPYVYEHGHVRITFDMNIRAVSAENGMFDRNCPGYSVLDQDLMIMEIKYTQFLPDIFRNIMPDDSLRLASSKYVMSIDTLRRLMVK